MVVIRIGRKRSMQAWKIASSDVLLVLSFRRQGKIDHQDRVLLHDANQQDHSDQRDHAQIDVEYHQREHGANAGRWQRRQNRDGMDEAFVQHPQHDVNRQQRGDNQKRLAGERRLERLATFPKTFRESMAGMPIEVSIWSIAAAASLSATPAPD